MIRTPAPTVISYMQIGTVLPSNPRLRHTSADGSFTRTYCLDRVAAIKLACYLQLLLYAARKPWSWTRLCPFLDDPFTLKNQPNLLERCFDIAFRKPDLAESVNIAELFASFFEQ